MAKYVVAVSGGVDSVVLLDAMCRMQEVARQNVPAGDIIVAHFDHGIRDDSADDAAFVKNLADNYGVTFVSVREELGAGTSEDTARTRRYKFLFSVCDTYNATLVTAHHADDAVETIAINLTRGTGWRGVAVLDNDKILRPLVEVTKQDILKYAERHSLTWHEDSTNASDIYMRNRIRRQLDEVSSDTKRELLALRARQVEIKQVIDSEMDGLIGNAPYSRYFFSHCSDAVAIELLRRVFVAQTGASPATKPRGRALHAIKVAKPGAVAHVADGVALRFTQRDFIVETSL